MIYRHWFNFRPSPVRSSNAKLVRAKSCVSNIDRQRQRDLPASWMYATWEQGGKRTKGTNRQRGNEDRTRFYVVRGKEGSLNRGPTAVNTYQYGAEFWCGGFLSPTDVYKAGIDPKTVYSPPTLFGFCFENLFFF